MLSSWLSVCGCVRSTRSSQAEAARPLDHWLTNRFHAYSARMGLLWRTPVRHEPWPLVHATTVALTQTLTRAAGLPDPETEPTTHTSPCVGPVRLGPARPA
ncbi:DUF2071 domain-containing protein [Streptomyces sp. NBC_00047]|uniref:DUF2071 domain-containing protein n=1 Tax=Streptomyces sp. NBC_00047 TaxID=2975627 RepID=UPI00224EAACB|nr:DUF2071 domain-containing protein [Streptomyces sp. NBC_00047]MCX5610162.1 DUF2071 domain-containing protein [Streptomyces sp. NBC_00047]